MYLDRFNAVPDHVLLTPRDLNMQMHVSYFCKVYRVCALTFTIDKVRRKRNGHRKNTLTTPPLSRYPRAGLPLFFFSRYFPCMHACALLLAAAEKLDSSPHDWAANYI